MSIKWQIEKRNIDELKGYEKNPRKFTDKGLKDLKKSLENCGDANIITINKDNTVLGGHARLTVMKQLGYKEVDVKVPDRLLNDKECQEIVIRLNANTAGEWDFEKLEADFDTEELEDWGLDDFISMEDAEIDMPELASGDRDPFQQMTFTLADAQAEVIKQAIADIKQTEQYKYAETFGNENTNGNALYCIIERFING